MVLFFLYKVIKSHCHLKDNRWPKKIRVNKNHCVFLQAVSSYKSYVLGVMNSICQIFKNFPIYCDLFS